MTEQWRSVTRLERADFYAEYKLQICRIEREMSFTAKSKAATPAA